MIRRTIPTVYKIRHVEDIEIIAPLNKVDYDRATFDGTSCAAGWIPIRVERVHEDLGKKFVQSDLPASSLGDLVLNRKAKERIGTFLEQYGELLPLACNDGEFWTLNVTCMIDALDEALSVLHRSKQDGSILIIDKHAFRPEALINAVMFRLPQYAPGNVFVTTPFVELIQSSGLTGLKFKQIWAPN